MREKFIVLFMVAVLLLTFIFNSCNELTTAVNEESIKQESRVLKKGTTQDNNSTATVTETGKLLGYKVVDKDGKKVKVPIYYGNTNDQIQPDRYPCNYYAVDHYELDHYESKTGKWLGIWQADGYYKSCSELYSKWGFNNYLCKDQWWQNVAKDAGFKDDSLMGFVYKQDNGGYHFSSGNYNNFFLDEPVEDDFTPYKIEEIASLVYPAKLYMSSYVYPEGFGVGVGNQYKEVLTAKSNTLIMCDQYYDGSISCGNDQRSYWTKFKNFYGSDRVKSHWISLFTDGEQNDFERLISHANSLGVKSLWVYAGNKVDNSFLGLGCGNNETLTTSKFNSYLQNFCNAAFNYGWLRGFFKKYRYWYKCPEYYGDPCYCKNTGDGWVLDHISYMGVYELYPN